jgi:hypothetical protein
MHCPVLTDANAVLNMSRWTVVLDEKSAFHKQHQLYSIILSAQ